MLFIGTKKNNFIVLTLLQQQYRIVCLQCLINIYNMYIVQTIWYYILVYTNIKHGIINYNEMHNSTMIVQCSQLFWKPLLNNILNTYNVKY